MTDFQILVASDAESFAKLIREKLDKGYKMVNSNMCIRSFSAQSEFDALRNIGNLRDRSIREFYAYMEKEVEPPKPISY